MGPLCERVDYLSPRTSLRGVVPLSGCSKTSVLQIGLKCNANRLGQRHPDGSLAGSKADPRFTSHVGWDQPRIMGARRPVYEIEVRRRMALVELIGSDVPELLLVFGGPLH